MRYCELNGFTTAFHGIMDVMLLIKVYKIIFSIFHLKFHLMLNLLAKNAKSNMKCIFLLVLILLKLLMGLKRILNETAILFYMYDKWLVLSSYSFFFLYYLHELLSILSTEQDI